MTDRAYTYICIPWAWVKNMHHSIAQQTYRIALPTFNNNKHMQLFNYVTFKASHNLQP